MNGQGDQIATVLVLDDDPGILLLERKALERAGYGVIAATSAEEAFAAIANELPDLLVLDYQVGPATGLDFYRELRQRHRDRPAILVTGFSDESRTIEALRAGIRDVVPKVGDYLGYLPEAVGRVLQQVQAAQKLMETEAANRAKDHFLAVLSHELRTPLTPVLTAVQIIEQWPELPDDLREPLDAIRRNVQLEARLIDDLLDLTRVSRGKLELQLSSTDVHEKLRNAMQTVDADARAKGLRMIVELRATRTMARGDSARLQQIFWNVLKNAVKFTPSGGTITVRTGDDEANARIRVEVIDNGVGIEPSVLPGIFNAFEQGGRDVTRSFGGLGLGLNITKSLVEAHGGSIAASSAGKGHGATFTITLPAAAAAARAPLPSPPDAASIKPASSKADVRVLIVEDHIDTSRLMARLLRGSGYSVATADSVSAALQTADTDHFDVVVSDIGLPDGTGFDLMRQLLARRPVKGIALSGFGMEEDVQRSKEAGFVEHLTKPIDPGRLEALIQELTRNS